MIKYIDVNKNRLVFLGENATQNFWQLKWNTFDLQKELTDGLNKRSLVIRTTKKYLPMHSKILEGGCGTGKFVNSLNNFGFDAYGIDFAADTIKQVKKLLPGLKLQAGDVTKLPYDSSYFDGYWSLGVIEHSYGGFKQIIEEAGRVLKPGGYLFVSFPNLSPLRKLKKIFKFYKIWDEKRYGIKKFYQFAYNKKNVLQQIESMGFSHIRSYNYDAFKGIKDEVPALASLLKNIQSVSSLPARVFRFLIEVFFRKTCGHMVLLVFKLNSPK